MFNNFKDRENFPDYLFNSSSLIIHLFIVPCSIFFQCSGEFCFANFVLCVDAENYYVGSNSVYVQQISSNTFV